MSEEPTKSRFSGWGVVAGILSIGLLSPLVFVASIQGGWIGPIAVLVFLAGFVTFLYRAGNEGLALGIAAGYVLMTVVSAGFCTGWNQGAL